jgi:hypothetical protein
MGIIKFLSKFVSPHYTDEKGYLRSKVNGELLHRRAAEERVGRKLRPGEVVHHIDRDKKNNKKSNLWVF